MALHVTFGARLEGLAEGLIDQLKKDWNDPFESPVVVFPNRLVEQWFKQYCVKREKALANLTCLRVERFAWQALRADYATAKGAKADAIGPLPMEYLALAIVAYLKQPDVLDKELFRPIKNYCAPEGQIDERKLYDLAARLAMLFLEYERSRPAGKDDAGFIAAWQKASPRYFGDKEPDKEAWQQALYAAVLQKRNGDDSILEKALKKILEGKGVTQLITLPYLAQEVEEVTTTQMKGPVYFFGLAGLGQTYLSVLRKYADAHQVYAYVPDVVSGVTSSLAEKWGEHGRSATAMWRTLIDLNKGDELAESKDKFALPDPHVLSAPSKLREIEALHTNVCRLLKEGEKLSDMLVVAPDMPAYAMEIRQVFAASYKGDGVHIPVQILNANAKASFVAAAIEKLFSITREKDVTRADFFDLINNPVVKAVRGLSDDDVGAYAAWVNAMGVYRDGSGATAARQDWLRATRRLLLSTLSGDSFGGIEPYADMDSGDEGRLFRFVALVDDLEDWLTLVREPETITGADRLQAIRGALEKWAHLEKPSDDMKGEAFLFTRALEALEQTALLLHAGCDEVPMATIERAVLSVFSRASYARGDVFTGGLSFATFDASVLPPAKHVFFLGCDSRAFPGEDQIDSLDLRRHRPMPGDVTRPSRNLNGFLSLVRNTGASLTLSFVNKDLQKDEDFYASSVILDLREALMEERKESLKEKEIPLDEKRPWRDLFTSRARRNRAAYDRLVGEKDAVVQTSTPLACQDAGEKPKRVTISQLKNFLEDPCKFQIERRLKQDDADDQSAEIEPIAFAPLEWSNVVR